MSEYTPDTIFKRSHLNNAEIIFRLAREDDLPKLEWLGEYTHFRRVFRYTYNEQQQGARLMLLAAFNDFPIGQIFIYLREQSLIFSHEAQRGYLYSLRVMLPFQNLGLGTDLILQAEAIMKERGMKASSIAVAKDNPKALRLYQRLGYDIYADDDGVWSYTNHENQLIHVNEPCWMLEKRLNW